MGMLSAVSATNGWAEQPAAVIVVVGPHGSGKTRWILKQLTTAAASTPGPDPLYLSLGGAGLPLDALYLRSQWPALVVLTERNLGQVEALLEQGVSLYLEIDATLDLSQLEFPGAWPLRRVAIVPPRMQGSVWQAWADEMIDGDDATGERARGLGGQELEGQGLGETGTGELAGQLWTAELTGQVFDPASLAVLWGELTQGAYGEVVRAKGIFSLASGETVWLSYGMIGQGLARSTAAGPGQPDASAWVELSLPLTVTGRPTYPSGIEVVGNQLVKAELVATIQDCLLSDELVAHYQAQIQEQLAEEAVEEAVERSQR